MENHLEEGLPEKHHLELGKEPDGALPVQPTLFAKKVDAQLSSMDWIQYSVPLPMIPWCAIGVLSFGGLGL